MALPLQPGLTPAEVAFLCEMETITVVARQRLDAIQLIGGTTPVLRPPQRTNIQLWLALLLKRQRRVNIVAPPWLHPSALAEILNLETETYQTSFTPAARLTTRQRQQTKGLQDDTAPPFLPLSTADQDNGDKLPYHWLEMGELLLDAASDDIEDPDQVRRLMRDLREVRMAKLRAGIEVLDAGGGVKMNGVGGMEVAEGRQFIGGVIDGLRRIHASREQARRERDEEGGGGNGFPGSTADDDDDDDML